MKADFHRLRLSFFFIFYNRNPDNIMNAGLRDMQCLKYERGQKAGIDAIHHHT